MACSLAICLSTANLEEGTEHPLRDDRARQWVSQLRDGVHHLRREVEQAEDLSDPGPRYAELACEIRSRQAHPEVQRVLPLTGEGNGVAGCLGRSPCCRLVLPNRWRLRSSKW